MWDMSLTDEVVLERYIGDSYGFGNESYGEGVLIKCLIVLKHRVIRRDNGVDITSDIQYTTRQKVNIQDKLDGKEVIEVKPIKDVFGNVIHYEAYT